MFRKCRNDTRTCILKPLPGLDFLRAQQMAAGLPPGHVDPHLLHLHRAYAEAAHQAQQAAAGIRPPPGLPPGVPPGMPPGMCILVLKLSDIDLTLIC